MSMTYTADQTSRYKQRLGIGAGVPIPASEVKVYSVKTGKLKRIEDKDGNRIRGNKCLRKIRNAR